MTYNTRLPPLQVIGRSQRIETEEPPKINNEINSLMKEYESYPEETVYIPPSYEHKEGDGEITADVLSKLFRVVQPGDHVCKRNVNEDSQFVHYKQSVELASKYGELRRVLEKKAELQLLQDCLSRLQAATEFWRELQNVVAQENEMWDNICHNRLQCPPDTKLENLSSILADLRIHMEQWNLMKRRLHMNPWLQKSRPLLIKSLRCHRLKLQFITETSLSLVDRLIHVGIKVLAHCDLDRLSPDALWSVTRGLEDFNTLVVAVKANPLHDTSSNATPWCPVRANSLYVTSFQPVQFTRILNLLACERAHYAAKTTQQFFTNDKDFLKLVLKKPLPEFDWCESHSTQNPADNSGLKTSDYSTGSQLSLNTSMLLVGDLVAPDLSQNAAPLFEFSRRENSFAQRFLHIVCNSTDLLKPSMLDTTTPKSSDRALRKKSFRSSTRFNNKTNTKKPPDNDHPTNNNPPEALTVAPLSRSDPKRKSVSWSDAGENSAIQALTARYISLLWQYTQQHLTYFVRHSSWSSDVTWPSDQCMGSIDLCPVTARMLIVKMIQQTCLKDIFPPGVVPALHTVSLHIQACAAWNQWDHVLCSALASQVSDKCYPCPMADGQFASKTSIQLRNSLRPLVLLINILQDKTTQPDGVGKVAGIMLPTMHRLQATFDLTLRWCQTKSSQFLAAQAISPFLLVIKSDLKMMSDECSQCLQLSQPACVSETDSCTQLAAVWHQLDSLHSQLQVLSGSMLKQFQANFHSEALEFFKDEMPTGKMWRKKTSSDQTLVASDYVSRAVHALLEPVLTGAGQLSSTAQLTVISLTVCALCEAWLQHILQAQITFSVQGAVQLEADFAHVRYWLQTRLVDDNVRSSILALDTLRNLGGVIMLLKQQPGGEAHSNRIPATSSFCCDLSPHDNSVDAYHPTNGHPCQVSYQVGGGVTINHLGDDQSEQGYLHKVPRANDWLALRLVGGNRKWLKMPSCLGGD